MEYQIDPAQNEAAKRDEKLTVRRSAECERIAEADKNRTNNSEFIRRLSSILQELGDDPLGLEVIEILT